MFLESLGVNGAGLGYYQNTILTDGGAGSVAQNNSVNILNIDSATLNTVLDQYNSTISEDTTFGHFVVKNLTFATRQVPWAQMRVVGIETVMKYAPSQPLLPRATDHGENLPLGIGFGGAPRILLKNYRVSGSANLFLQDGFIDGTFFDVERFELGGLRAYPILKSPKTLKIDVAVSGEGYYGSAAALGTALNILGLGNPVIPTDTTVTFSVNALVDVMVDTTYGRSSPTPATRGLNMVRIPPRTGQSFIIGE
jgi:hypothetical protein